jgi:hypothetical protein
VEVDTGFQPSTFADAPLGHLFWVKHGETVLLGMRVMFNPTDRLGVFLEVRPGDNDLPSIRDALSRDQTVALINNAVVCVASAGIADSELHSSGLSGRAGRLAQVGLTTYLGCVDGVNFFWVDLSTGIVCERTPNGQPTIEYRSWHIVRRVNQAIRGEPIDIPLAE